MQQDYTINDAHHDGFECGMLYILRYAAEDYDQLLSDDDVKHLVVHLAQKKPWKTTDEWEELILNNLNR
jgi:hypothetical protein